MARNRVWNGKDYESCETQETNGNLTYVVKEDGTSDWVAPHELEERPVNHNKGHAHGPQIKGKGSLSQS
jgi:hypothetical protein